MIGKIEKARRYAEEPSRAQVQEIVVKFRGEHDIYDVRFHDGQWTCSCHSFGALQLGTCSHVMAMERLLGQMLPETAAVG
jgi:hypothetical protein